MWAIANIKLLAIGVATLAVFGSGWWVSSQIWEGRMDRALKAQELALHAQCDENKKLTEESSREYQTKVSDLTRKLSAAKRLLPARCIVPITGTPSGSNGSTATGEHARLDGISTVTLLDYGASCERLRLQVISLQDFINETWKTH